MKLNINDEQGIELLHFIFERELKPPFRKGNVDSDGYYPYYNRNDDIIGWFGLIMKFDVHFIIFQNIKHKICQVFEFSYDTLEWWHATKPHLKSWLESQLNIKIRYLYP